MKCRFCLCILLCVMCCERNLSVIYQSGLEFLFWKLVGKLVLATSLLRTFEIGRLEDWHDRGIQFSVVNESPRTLSSSNVITVHSEWHFNVGQQRNVDRKLLASVISEKPSFIFCCRLDDEKLDLINVSNFDKMKHYLLQL